MHTTNAYAYNSVTQEHNNNKNCFLTQNFTEIGQSAAELAHKKRLLKRRKSAVLNIKNVHFLHLAVIEFQMCCCVPNVNKTGWFFCDGDLMICNMADIAHL